MIGIYEGGGSECGTFTMNSANTLVLRPEDIPANTTAPYASDTSGSIIPVRATVEPDADNDGFGDETQDGCPTDPNTHAACPAPPDITPPSALLSVPKQKLSKVLKSGKLVEQVKTSEAGAISAQAVLSAKLTKKLKLPAIVAKGATSASKAGTYKVTLKLTKSARKKLAKLKKVSFTLRTTVSDTAGNRRLVKKGVTLRR
jgi:hypothetical protein